MSTTQQENKVSGSEKEDRPVKTAPDGATAVSHTPHPAEPKVKEPVELLTNEIFVDKGKETTNSSVYLNKTLNTPAYK